MPLLRQKWIFRSDLRANPGVLYIFGDNEQRVGLGGQAKEMRGEVNAVGVATLRAPGEFWNREDTARQCAVIDSDLRLAIDALRQGKIVVYPLDGIGTGLAALEAHAPDAFAHLQARIDEMERI